MLTVNNYIFSCFNLFWFIPSLSIALRHITWTVIVT